MLLALLRIDWSVPLAASLAATAAMSPTQTDQINLTAAPQAVASFTPSLTNVIPISATPAATASLTPNLGHTVPLASFPRAQSSAPAMLIDQDSLLSFMTGQASIVSGLLVQKPIASPLSSVTSINAQIGNSLMAVVTAQATLNSGTTIILKNLSTSLQPQALLTASLIDLWNRELSSGVWIEKANLGLDRPPFGLLGLSWQINQGWSSKIKSSDTWTAKTPGAGSWSNKPNFTDPWVRKHG